jgi:hypothetical protein
MKPTAPDIMAMLRRIERREVTLKCINNEPPRDIYCGNCTFETSDGWTIVIFNDCDEWDYIDHVTDPDGDTATFDDFWRDTPFGSLNDNEIDHPACYKPSEQTVAEIWGFG